MTKCFLSTLSRIVFLMFMIFMIWSFITWSSLEMPQLRLQKSISTANMWFLCHSSALYVFDTFNSTVKWYMFVFASYVVVPENAIYLFYSSFTLANFIIYIIRAVWRQSHTQIFKAATPFNNIINHFYVINSIISLLQVLWFRHAYRKFPLSYSSFSLLVI